MLNTDFTAYIRTLDGDWQALDCWQVKVDMHQVRVSSMVYFDFTGTVEVKIVSNRWPVYRVEIRPLSRNIIADFTEHEIKFRLTQPEKLSIEINGERFLNLHLFAGLVCDDEPDIEAPMVKVLSAGRNGVGIHRTSDLMKELAVMPPGRTLYYGPGIHYMEECVVLLPSSTNVYIHGEAVVIGGFVMDHASDIRLYGRGVLYLADFERFSGINAIRLSYAKRITIDGLHIINPPHYTVYIGGSDQVLINNLTTFSCEGWSDGIDMMSSTNVTVKDCFLRTSDDCIAIYGRRWGYQGDSRNIEISGSILWADVAHPTIIGTHGDHKNNGNILEQITFDNLDILEHHEAQAGYLGCLAINPGDKNIVRDVTYRNIRIEPFSHGKVLDLQVKCNPDYNPEPGGGIFNILFQDIFYSGDGEVPSVIRGYDAVRKISGIRFKNLVVRNKKIMSAEQGNIAIGKFTETIEFR